MRKLKLFFACLLMAVLSIGQVWATDVDDVLTAGLFEATSTTYKDFSDVAAPSSDAVYAGNSAKTSSGGIQLRSKNSNSGIVSTTSGGKVKSIAIVVESGSATVDFYGSNDAYSSAADLYGSSKGTKLGSLSATGSIDVDGDYEYVGIRSNNGALYLTSVTITWTTGGSSDPTLSLAPSSLNLEAEGNSTQEITLSTTNFAGAVNDVTCAFFSTATCDPGDAISQPAWITNLSDNNTNLVSFGVVDNDGAARSVWMKVTASDGTGSASAILAISQKALVVDYATLPFAFTGGKSDIATTSGMTQSGLGSDYSGTANLKFDNQGDWLVIKFNAAPGTLSYDIKGNTMSGTYEFTVQESADGETYVDVETYSTLGAAQSESKNLTQTSRYVKFIYTTKASGNVGLGNIAISEYVAPATVAAPVISGDDPFLTETEVSITCETVGATIYYTTDGSDPQTSASKQTYSVPFTVNATTTTVTAIANLSSDWSIHTSKTFQKVAALTTMDQIFVAATEAGTTATPTFITFSDSWVVTGVSTNGKNAYITDGTKGMILYNNGANMGLVVGNTLSGTVQRSLKLYNGSAQLDAFTTEGLTIGTGSQPAVQELDAAGIEALNGANTGSLIKISGECSEESGKFKIGGVQLYNSLYSFSVSAGTSYECTGVYVQYNTNTANTKEILPRNAEDIVVSSSIAVTGVELTESTATVEVGLTVTLHASVVPGTATDKAIVWTVESGSDKASVDNGVVTGVAEGTAVIRAASHEDATKYSECTVTVTAADPTKHTVTFDATVDKGESPLSKSNITFTCSNGVLNNASEYRLYQNSTTTFACSTGNILKIEFTGVSGKPVSGFEDPEVGTLVIDGNDGVWTGNATSVSFVASGAQVRATQINVTYKEDNREEAGIAFTPENVSITEGEPWTKPSFINPNGLTVSFNSDNTSVASVSNEGVVALEGGIGTAVITATFDGDEDYKPATVTYTITVNAPLSPWAYVYTSNITVGSDIVQFSDEESAPTYEAMKTGTGNAWGSTTVTVPMSTTKLHFHAVCYGADSKAVKLNVKKGESVLGTFDINKDAGAKGSSPFILENTPYEQYYCVNLSEISAPTEITFEADNSEGKRFIIFGVNQEGGVVPVLQSLAISGDLDNKTYEAGQALDMTGLTVTGTYDVGAPADVTSQVEEWLYDALEAGDESVTISARIGNIVSPGVEITGLTVTDATPKIEVSPSFWNFNSVDQGAVVAGKAITVTLTNVAAATVALSGTGADGFSVDQDALTASGTITITPVTTTVGSFNATVTISDDAGVAADATITLMMNVQEADADDDLSGTWTLVTDPAQLIPGSRVIIAQYVSEDGAIKTMSTQANNNRTAVESTVACTTLSPAAHTRVMTVEIPEAGKFALRTNRNTYLYAASSSSNQLKEEPTLNDNGKWTISIDANGGAIITASGDHTRNVMRYNPNNGSPIFACYASSSTTGALVAIYARQADYTRNDSWMAPGELGTVCIEHGATAAGAQIYELAGKSGGGVVFTSVTTMEPGKPYLFQALSTRVDFFFTSATPAGTPDNSGAMKGTFVNLDITGADLENTYYVVGHKLYGTADLTTLNIPAYRAYVKMDEVQTFNSSNNAPGRHYIVMGVNGTNNATGVDNLNAEDAPVKKLVNGHLFIIRGEKTFDATGRLVK